MWKVTSGSLLLLLALFMLMGFFSAEIEGGAVVAGLALLIVVALPAAGGALLLRSHFARDRKLEARKDRLRRQTVEAELLRLAADRGGKLTVTEVVAETALDAETVEKALASLHARGVAELELADSGIMVYSFRDTGAQDEKESARGVLDA